MALWLSLLSVPAPSVVWADASIQQPLINAGGTTSLRVVVRVTGLTAAEELDLLALVLRGQPLRLTAQCRIYRDTFIDQVQAYRTPTGQNVELLTLSRRLRQDTSRFWVINEQDNFTARDARALRTVFPGNTRSARLEALRRNFLNAPYNIDLLWSRLNLDSDETYYAQCRAILEVTQGTIVLVHSSSFVTAWRNSREFRGN